MPSSPDEIDFEASSSPYSSSQRLSVPPTHSKMERHVSEPSPRMSSQSPPLSSAAMHLLTVPTHTPVLTKQHSAPSQSICDTQFSYHRQESHSHFSLHRQLSLPSTHSPPLDRIESFTKEEPLSGTSAGHMMRTPISTSISVSVSESKPIIDHLSPTFVVVTDPSDPSPSALSQPPMRVRSEELQRSVSSPQVCILLIYIHIHFQHSTWSWYLIHH